MKLFNFSLRAQSAPCLVIASNGRSGSTLMFDALRAAQKRRQRWPKSKASFEIDLGPAALEPGSLVKTHDFPGGLKGKKDVKVLFCFGSAKASALSVYSALERFGREWVDQHFAHLHAQGSFEDLFRYDVLNQAEQMKQWATFQDVPVMCLNYEAIWSRQAEVAEFMGLDFTVPERTARAAKNIPDDILARAAAVYDPIDAVLDELPELFVASPEYAGVLEKLPKHRAAA